MSDIKCHLTGKIFFQVDPTVAALFIECGLAEPLRAPKKSVAAPKFALGHRGERTVLIYNPRMEVGAPEEVFDGTPIPEQVKRAFTHFVFNPQTQLRNLIVGEEVPDELVAAYCRGYIEIPLDPHGSTAQLAGIGRNLKCDPPEFIK